MRRRALKLQSALPFVLAALATAVVASAADEVATGPRDCAAQFGAVLRSGDAKRLAPMLPQRGKIRLRLVRLGAEQGSFSPAQVQAVFQDFFKNGSVGSFELAPSETGATYALIRARAEIIDRHGMPSTVELHLVLEREGERWVLREIGEAQR